MKKKIVIPSLIVLSLLLTGCSFQEQLGSLIQTEQVKLAEGDWVKEGNTYTTTVHYESPGGQEENDFTITTDKSGKITSVDVAVKTDISASIRYQQGFKDALPELLVGKDITTVDEVDILSGASLTTDAFNSALRALKAQMS